MFSKLSPFRIPLLIPNCFFSIRLLSALARSTHVQLDPATGLDPNFHNPDTLIRVSDDAHDLSSPVKLFDWASLQSNCRHISTPYFKVSLKLDLAGNVQEMQGFCREMVKAKCPNAQDALLSLLDLLMDNGRLREATRVILVFASTGYHIPIHKFNRLLGELVDKKMGFSHALLVYKEMLKLGIVPNVYTLNHLIKALFDASRMENALDQFRRMAKKRCAPNYTTFEILVCSLLGANRVDESIGRVNEMLELGCNPDESFYSSVIPLLLRANRPREAIRLLEMMRASKVPLSSPLYEALIRCLCIYLGNPIDATSYTTIMHGLSQSGRSKETLVLLAQMLKVHLGLDGEAYCDLIQCMMKLDKVRDVVVVGNMMFSGGSVPDSKTLIDVLEYSAKHGKLHMILGAIDKVEHEGGVVNSATYSILISGLWREGYKRKANEFLDSMLGKGWLLDANVHSLFTSSHGRKVDDRKIQGGKRIDQDDEISSILSEGLGGV